jgi:hypothetical protein
MALSGNVFGLGQHIGRPRGYPDELSIPEAAQHGEDQRSMRILPWVISGFVCRHAVALEHIPLRGYPQASEYRMPTPAKPRVQHPNDDTVSGNSHAVHRWNTEHLELRPRKPVVKPCTGLTQPFHRELHRWRHGHGQWEFPWQRDFAGRLYSTHKR